MNLGIRKPAITLGLAAILIVSHLGMVDSASEAYAGAAFKRALVTYALARSLNGVISVAQGTEIALQPAGVGVTLTAGEILDPVNDLVERFSWIVLASATSLGIQEVLLAISRWWGVSVLLLLCAFGYLAAVWTSRPSVATMKPFLRRLLLAAVFLRFAVPLLMLATAQVFDLFLAEEQRTSAEALTATSSEIRQLNTGGADEQTFLGRLGTAFGDTMDTVNVQKRIEQFRDRIASAVEHLINLMVIFALETLIIPLAFLWGLIALFKRLA